MPWPSKCAVRLWAVLAVTGVAGTMGIALATIPDEGGVIHGCYASPGGSIRIIDDSVTGCRHAETAISWNVAGPRGPRGLQGEKGDRGPRGLQGEPGATGSVTLPAGRCWANGQRYVDCGNGTVTDQVTGLIWLQDSACLGWLDFAAANMAAQALETRQCGLTDGSVAGQWRLPTKEDWQLTIARASALGCIGFKFGPSLTDNSGALCYAGVTDGPGFHQRALWGAVEDHYWSSTIPDGNPELPWFATLSEGRVNLLLNASNALRVWPVRGGS